MLLFGKNFINLNLINQYFFVKEVQRRKCMQVNAPESYLNIKYKEFGGIVN